MQVFLTILIIGCLAAAAAALQETEIKQEWLNFKQKYHKLYTRSLEEQTRYGKFKTNLETIKNHNIKYNKGEVSYKMGINPFTDMDTQEMERTLMRIKLKNRDRDLYLKPTIIQYSPILLSNIPQSLDWRTKGIITPVKNQRQCGSCWAFSSTGALEAQYSLNYNKSIILSEQNLVDCVKGNWGCSGGWMHTAFTYIRRNDGINTESVYPYEGAQGQCRFQSQHEVVTCKGYVTISSGDEQQLLQAVATYGPVSVAFYTLPSFFQYKSGVYDVESCTSNALHAVVIVGYGTENGRDYWLVKNSWSSYWGDQGYIKMSRNKNNQCGIATWASYPLM